MDSSGGTVRRLLAAVALGAAVWVLSPPVATAQSIGEDPFDCAAAIVDGAGVLETDVVAAEINLVDGAEIVVRSFDSVPDGDLGATIDDLVATCFVDADGNIQADIAVFSFSVDDRTTDVFLGSSLPGGSVPDDLANTMASAFPEDFTLGVTSAIAELDQRLGGATDGGSGPAGSGATDGGSGPAGSGDGDGGGLPAGVLVGTTAVLAVGAGGVAVVRRRRRLTDARNELSAAVVGPRARVGTVREQAARLDSQAELWGKVAVGATLETLHELRHRTRTAANDTERASALLSEATPGGIREASLEHIAKATERLAELRAALDRNEKSLDELFAFGARLDHLRVALPAKKDLLLGELEASETVLATRRTEGWIVDEQDRELATIRAALSSTDLNDFALDLLALSERIEGAEALLFETDHELQSLPDRPAALDAWRAKQVEAAELEHRRVTEARRAIAALGAVHSAESWQWVADYPDRVEQFLSDAERLGGEAIELGTSQQFEAAGHELEEAGLRLIGADDLLDQIEDLVVDLDQAKMEAAGILEESRGVADQFATYVEQHRGDLGDHLLAKPSYLDDALDGLERELQQAVPNYLRVAQTADRINREVDDLLGEAQQQHQRMEALRRQAEREVARAVRSIRRTKESLGWQPLGSREGRQLEELERRLGSLPSEPQARFQAAQGLADEAVAIQERIIAHRRRGGNWIIVGGGMGGGGTWGGGSSSSGTGMGRGFGGGGGGRSFGGGGGGRSFGGGRGTGSW